VAAVRLERLKQEFAPGIEIFWKAYPLVADDIPGRRFNSYLAGVWARASEEEPSLIFKHWPDSEDLPSSSLPALEAAKCAELQDRDRFARYHIGIFRAFFEQCRDISLRGVLLSVGAEVGLDVKRLALDLDRRVGEKLVLDDYREAKQSGSVIGVPTAIFSKGPSLEGAVPIEIYRRAVEVAMRGQDESAGRSDRK
jgi:predicted DsbA family dithiol-disulfide isomerase